MTGKYYSKELKEEIIGKIKTDGITGAEAARRYGISVKNIYRWLAGGIGGASSQVLEINRLKRENRELKEMIGQLMIEKKRGEKN